MKIVLPFFRSLDSVRYDARTRWHGHYIYQKMLEILTSDKTMFVEQLLHSLFVGRIKTLGRESREIARKKREIISMINRLSLRELVSAT